MSKKIQEKIEKETRYNGYFLMDSGLKIPFDISEDDGGEIFSVSLYGNMEFPFEKGDVIWLGENTDIKILADRIIGWDINKYTL
jgi:hypothetical protein